MMLENEHEILGVRLDWISVDDRLPDSEGEYEIKVNGQIESDQTVDNYHPGFGWMWDFYSIPQFRVSHWRH